MAVVDHLVYAVADLERATAWFSSTLGVRPAPGGSHPGRGTRNALAALGGGAYLEVIAPDGSQPPPDAPRPFGIDDVDGDRLVGFAVRPDVDGGETLESLVERCRSAGHDPGDPVPMSRVTPDGEELRWRLTSPAPSSATIPFLIDWGPTPHPSRTTPSGLHLVSLRAADPIDAPGAEEVRRALGLVDVAPADGVGLRASVAGPGGRRVEL
ncbi:VOC family protein [Ilumatobacter sp.]|uniref:VOC family protein n=1 Tax=Ilumatobacter sp. TaxID=1967498 RepID=UPI003B51651C